MSVIRNCPECGRNAYPKGEYFKCSYSRCGLLFKPKHSILSFIPTAEQVHNANTKKEVEITSDQFRKIVKAWRKKNMGGQ